MTFSAVHSPCAPGARLERHLIQPGDLLQDHAQVIQQRQRPLAIRLVLHRVQVRKPRQRRGPLVDLRVVLHRAGAERIEVVVHGKVAMRQVRVMPHHVKLPDLRQPGLGERGERRVQLRRAARRTRADRPPGHRGWRSRRAVFRRLGGVRHGDFVIGTSQILQIRFARFSDMSLCRLPRSSFDMLDSR